jgi:hypothetical protein
MYKGKFLINQACSSFLSCQLVGGSQCRRIFGRKIESRHISHQGRDEDHSNAFRVDRSVDLAKLQFAKRGLDPQDVAASVDGSAGVSAQLLGRC